MKRSKENPCIDKNGKKARCSSLNIEGTKYRTFLTEKFKSRKMWEPPDENRVSSYIPGTIIEVSVKVGDRLKEGDQLLILEAMKMFTRVTIPKDGVVKTIHVKKGQRIAKGEVMVEFK